MIRNHKIFTVTMSVTRQNRQEDAMGELIGYSQPYETTVTKVVIAPNVEIAKAWALQREQINGPAVGLDISEQAIDGFVWEPTW